MINPPIRNQLLGALISTEYAHLVPHLERVDLALGENIYLAGGRIENVYFPENSVVSLLSTMENGATTEVGLVGREGMVGLTVFLGGALDSRGSRSTVGRFGDEDESLHFAGRAARG